MNGIRTQQVFLYKCQHCGVMTSRRSFICTSCLQTHGHECSICYDHFDYLGIHQLGCGHIFCKKCLEQFMWGKMKEGKYDFVCPLCRSLISTDDASVVMHQSITDITCTYICDCDECIRRRWIDRRYNRPSLPGHQDD